MRRVWWMAAAAAAVLDVSMPTMVHSASRDRAEPAGAVTALSIARVAGRAEVSIAVTGEVNVEDFVLASPHRIVIDIKGAALKMTPPAYDRIVRGGITNVRIAQTNAADVRIVLDVDRNLDYKVERGDGDVHVTLESSEEFEPWISGVTSASVPAPRLEVTPPAPVVAAPPVAAPAVIPVSSAPILQQVGGRISVTFNDADLRDVLSAFSDRSGRSIVTSVTGIKINATIVNQPWQTALKAILDAYGLAAVEDPVSHIIVVGTAAALRAQVASEPLETRRIALNYAKADVLALTIQALLSADCGAALQVVGGAPAAGGAGGGAAAGDMGTSGAAAGAGGAGAPPGAGNVGVGAQPIPAQGAQQPQQVLQPGQQSVCPARGRVVAEPSTNSLIITEAQTHIDSLMGYVAAFDVQPQQINIKAQVISINRTNTDRLGISYDLGSNGTFYNTLAPRTATSGATTGEFQVTLGGDAFAGVANASRTFKSNSAVNLLYNMALGNFSVTSFLDALSQEQLTDITASPSISTVDKKLATLFAGVQQAFLLTPPTQPGAIQAAAPQISSLNVGITLNVTPSISANRMVRLNVFAEQSSILNISVAGPTSSRKTVQTEMLVHDGETLAISGLTQEEVQKTRRGIPLLMNLPMIGRLFSENENIITKDDLLILITPHILDDSVPIKR